MEYNIHFNHSANPNPERL